MSSLSTALCARFCGQNTWLPEDGLIRMLPEARALGIPALVNGLIDNDFRKTAEAVFRITREKNTGGVQITGTMLAQYLPFSTASYGWQGLVMLLAAVSVWRGPEQYQGRLFLLWLCSVVWLNGANGAVPVLAGMGMTLLVLCLVHEYVPASSKRLQISRWFAEGYALHLLIIAGMVNGLQVQA